MAEPTRRCGVLGDPIEHSLSPVLHRAGYAAVGLDWTYDAHRVPAGGLPEFLAGLDPTWRGLSLTMPLKREAMTLVDDVTPHATVSGAVNTLVLDDGLHGHNTDLPGRSPRSANAPTDPWVRRWCSGAEPPPPR
ncbi:shikimate dehydrogenase family protein [Nocardioides houyundeii]|uniref:shikimate dehydrogenase family protein n=1 Tax=Nocardioides houyundeii TaxID=2045452 RepID=UPI001F5322D8|nr:hypothetical protein [Nocardioides houyundeii]